MPTKTPMLWPGRPAWWDAHLSRLSARAKRGLPLFDEADARQAFRQRLGLVAALMGE
jgi:hypothetical protein